MTNRPRRFYTLPTWRRAVVWIGGVTLIISISPVGHASSPSHQDSRTRISQTLAFDAPIGDDGGVSNPVVWCSDYSEPQTVWTLMNVDTGWTRTWRWRGSYPGYYFPRVPVGTYKSKTQGTCRGTVNSRTQIVTVEEKTLAGTVSRGEWRHIERGMTRAHVAAIIGTDGRDGFRYNGKLTLTYDMMDFWAWSLISYRDGRVVTKAWNVGHD